MARQRRAKTKTYLDSIPPAQALRETIEVREEELRQLRILLETAEKIERGGHRPEHDGMDATSLLAQEVAR